MRDNAGSKPRLSLKPLSEGRWLLIDDERGNEVFDSWDLVAPEYDKRKAQAA